MNLTAAAVGVAFGAMLLLSGLADYDVIHRGLLLQEAHLYLMMVSTMVVGIPLLAFLRRRHIRTPFGGVLTIARESFQAKNLKGGAVFGVGWAVAGTCPGAVAAMVGSGRWYGLFVMFGIALGVLARDRQEALAASAASAPVPS